MGCQQLYQLTLDDSATPSFISFTKPFYGSLSDIRCFIEALEQDEDHKENYKELTEAFRAYESGSTDVKHHAAYQEIQLLKPVKVLASRTTNLKDYRWTHMNVWDCPYELRCEELIAEQTWIEQEGTYLRCLRAKFRKLEFLSSFDQQWRDLNDGFWGYLHMLDYDEPYVFQRLWVIE